MANRNSRRAAKQRSKEFAAQRKEGKKIVPPRVTQRHALEGSQNQDGDGDPGKLNVAYLIGVALGPLCVVRIHFRSHRVS